MNAISVTMVKGTNSQALHNYAIRLTAVMVTLSWLGWQMLIISGCYQRRGLPDRAADFLEGALVLLFYSLHLFLRLKRREAVPSREAAQLFFGAFLVILPGMTWAVWHELGRLLHTQGKITSIYGANGSLQYTCIILSAIYAVVILTWMQTNIPYYTEARKGSWSWRVMRRLELWVVDPYFKR